MFSRFYVLYIPERITIYLFTNEKMFLFALVMALLITSCGQKQKGSNTLIRPVKTAQVSSQSVIRKDFSGIVEAVEYVRLAFRVSGQIISLPVVEGQRVKRGN